MRFIPSPRLPIPRINVIKPSRLKVRVPSVPKPRKRPVRKAR